MILRAFIFLLAIGAAGGAAWLTMQTGAESRAATIEVRTAKAPTVDVLVAAADIPGGEVLSPEKLRWEPWPASNMNASFITRAERPKATDELSGTFVNAGFAGGEPIREGRLTAANANLLSSKIEPGMRAAAVKVTAESAAGGFILPGDRVDVIRTVTIPSDGAPRTSSHIIMSNVRVLAIDQTVSQTPEGNVLGKTATLELSPAEAELIMAAEASGMLSLALRSAADHGERTATTREPPVRSVLVRRGSERSTVTIR